MPKPKNRPPLASPAVRAAHTRASMAASMAAPSSERVWSWLAMAATAVFAHALARRYQRHPWAAHIPSRAVRAAHTRASMAASNLVR